MQVFNSSLKMATKKMTSAEKRKMCEEEGKLYNPATNRCIKDTSANRRKLGLPVAGSIGIPESVTRDLPPYDVDRMMHNKMYRSRIPPIPSSPRSPSEPMVAVGRPRRESLSWEEWEQEARRRNIFLAMDDLLNMYPGDSIYLAKVGPANPDDQKILYTKSNRRCEVEMQPHQRGNQTELKPVIRCYMDNPYMDEIPFYSIMEPDGFGRPRNYAVTGSGADLYAFYDDFVDMPRLEEE